MTLTDSDPELARLGFLSARLHMLPRELAKKGTPTELQFLEYWIKKVDSDDSEKHWYLLNRALGTLWERSDFTPKEKSYSTKVVDRIWYPLSLLLSQTDIKKVIKKDFVQQGQQIGAGEYTPEAGEDIVSLGQEATKEQFLDFLQKFAGPVTSQIAQNTSPDPPKK